MGVVPTPTRHHLARNPPNLILIATAPPIVIDSDLLEIEERDKMA